MAEAALQRHLDTLIAAAIYTEKAKTARLRHEPVKAYLLPVSGRMLMIHPSETESVSDISDMLEYEYKQEQRRKACLQALRNLTPEQRAGFDAVANTLEAKSTFLHQFDARVPVEFCTCCTENE